MSQRTVPDEALLLEVEDPPDEPLLLELEDEPPPLDVELVVPLEVEVVVPLDVDVVVPLDVELAVPPEVELPSVTSVDRSVAAVSNALSSDFPSSVRPTIRRPPRPT